MARRADPLVRARAHARPVRHRVEEPRAGRGSWRRKLLVIAATTTLFAVAATGLLWMRMASFNEKASTEPALSTALLGPLVFSDEPINVLVLGYGGPQHDGPFLTDSMNVVSVSADDITTMIPIPRDLWIEGLEQIPGNGKINTAFAIGQADGGIDAGGDLAAEVVAAVTGLDIHYWIALDFEGFRATVDAVGGVPVENPVGFWYGSPSAFEAGIGWDGEFPAGTLELDGQQALFYARTRYTSEPSQSTDFARSQRQQRVLAAVLAKVRDAGLGGIGLGLAAMDALDDHLRTNLSVVDLALLIGHLSPDHRIELAEGTVLQATSTTDGQYVLVPIGQSRIGDYSGVARYIADALAALGTAPASASGASP